MISPKICRDYLRSELEAAIYRESVKVIDPDDRSSYQIGHQLGYVDGLKAAKDMLARLPDSDPGDKRYLAHRHDTW